MADFIYNTAGGEMWGGGTPLNILTDTKVKILLLEAGYTANRDHDLVDAGGASDVSDVEASGTGYVGGYGGSGRKTLASRTITIDKTNDRSEFDAADITWTAVNFGTAVAAVVAKEDHLGTTGNDTESRLISHHDTNFPVVTNGGDLTLQTPNGIIRLSTV